MESPSRRSFLTGRRQAQTPWEQFSRTMKRRIAGDFLDFGLYEGHGSGRLTPSQPSDINKAHALCKEYGVVLALSGVNQADSLTGQSVLWVELDGSLAGCQTLPDDDKKWFVRPGTLLSEMVDAGLTQFSDQPGYLTIAAWVADRSACGWAPGQAYRTGLLHASLLMADGTSAVLGPFGEANRQPLGTLTLQRLVPLLFALASGHPVTEFMQMEQWPARYRLDALKPGQGHDVNLAHLVLGHGGDLGWVEWLVFEAQPALETVDWSSAYTSRPSADNEPLSQQASTLDRQVKALFDPQGVFPNPGQDL